MTADLAHWLSQTRNARYQSFLQLGLARRDFLTRADSYNIESNNYRANEDYGWRI